MLCRSLVSDNEYNALYDIAIISEINSSNIFDLPYRFASWSTVDRDNILICEDESGCIISWAIIQLPFWTLDFAIKNRASLSSLNAILEWASRKMNDYHIKDSNRDCWFVTVKDNAKEAISILERHGLICQSNVGENAWEKIVYFKELNAKNEIGEKQYNIRSLSINHEVEMYVDLHQKVFGTKNMNSIWRNRTVNGTRYNNKYDLVCVDDDGELIGFCVGWGNLGKKIGQIEPMGVLKKYEGKGIGSSLIQELEKRMLEDGIRKLIVETDLSRESALGIYKKNGFTEESKVLVYKKDIS